MDLRLYQNLMRKIPLFAGLSQEEMGQLLRGSKLMRVRSGVTVINAGIAGIAMYMLIEGKVRIDRPLPGGGMALLAEAEAPSVIGEMALIDDRERTATVTTVSDSVMLQLPKATFSALREEFSPAAYKLIRRLALTLCERLEEKTERIVHFFEEQQLRG